MHKHYCVQCDCKWNCYNDDPECLVDRKSVCDGCFILFSTIAAKPKKTTGKRSHESYAYKPISAQRDEWDRLFDNVFMEGSLAPDKNWGQ